MSFTPVDLTAPQDWGFPVPIVYGPGRLAEIASLCARAKMSNPLIVTDGGSVNLPFIAQLEQHLSKGGLTSGLYGGIAPNPQDTDIAAGKAQFHQGNHDGIIAIGGGSGMDGGKAVALTAYHDNSIWDFEYESPLPDLGETPRFPPLITIPTTAGTGAETESTAMVTDTVKKMKWCIWHPSLKPSFALLDPEITLGLPPHLTAWTGIDAMVHAIEAYVVPDFNPLCDGMALEGLKLVSHYLPIAVKEPQNIEARGGMLVGSCLAGVAFLKGLGLVHAISHMVGAEYNTQHGLTNAILLPASLKHNAPSIAPKIKALSQAAGLDTDQFDDFHRYICALLDEVGIPKTLAEIGVPEDCAERIAEKALQDSAAGTNPHPLTKDGVASVVREAILTGR